MPMAEDAEGTLLAARMKLQGLDKAAEGSVRLSIPRPFSVQVLPKILAKFSELHPNIELIVNSTNRLEDVTRAEADVSVRVGFDVKDDVVGRKVLQYSAGVFASKEYLERYFSKAGPGGEGLHWIGNGRLWPVPGIEDKKLFPAAKRIFDTSDPIMKVDLVRRGYGMSIMPLSTLLLVEGLALVPGTPIVPERNVWVLVQTELKNTARVQAVVKFLTSHMRKLVDAENNLMKGLAT